MKKVIWLVPRAPNVTREYFVKRYLVHAPNITKLFGHLVQQYQVDFIEEAFEGLNGLSDDAAPGATRIRRKYDSVTEMAFWNQKAWDESLRVSPEVAKKISKSESSWIDHKGVINLFVDEHNFVQPSSPRESKGTHGKKAIWLLKRRPNVSHESFREQYLRHAPKIAYLIGHLVTAYQVNIVKTEFVGDAEGKQKDPFEGKSVSPSYDAVTSMTFRDEKAWDHALDILHRPEVAKQIDEAESHYLDRRSVITYFVDQYIYVPEGLPDVTVQWE